LPPPPKADAVAAAKTNEPNTIKLVCTTTQKTILGSQETANDESLVTVTYQTDGSARILFRDAAQDKTREFTGTVTQDKIVGELVSVWTTTGKEARETIFIDRYTSRFQYDFQAPTFPVTLKGTCRKADKPLL